MTRLSLCQLLRWELALDYLKDEVRVLRKLQGQKPLRFCDDQRRRLKQKANRIGLRRQPQSQKSGYFIRVIPGGSPSFLAGAFLSISDGPGPGENFASLSFAVATSIPFFSSIVMTEGK